MSKHDHEFSRHAAKPEPMPATGCVVCGGWDGLPVVKLPVTEDQKPRWHAECEAARPDVIKKVKARA